jgi:hypothetical protein
MAGMKTLRTAAPPTFVSIYFLALTWRAVSGFFSPDDLMNIYQSWWSESLWPIVKANLLFFQPSPWPRPLATLCLRLMYEVAGFHAPPFKMFDLVILVVNIFLTYAVARRLGRSRTAGAIVAMLVTYHGQSLDLYYNSGYIFDVLCYFFYFAAVFIYLRARSQGRFPGAGELTACCVLYVAALDSKELAVSLPLFLLLYEVLYHGVGSKDWRYQAKRWAGVLATGMITLAMIAGRVLRSELVTESAYKPKITAAQFMRTSLDFAGNLFCRPGAITPAVIIGIWIAMLIVAWLSRSTTLRFAWLFLMLSPLPIAFIDPRGLSQYYIPLFGWALYVAGFVDLALWQVLRRVHPAHPARARIYASSGLVFGSAAVLFVFWSGYPAQPVAITLEGEDIRSMTRQLHRLAPTLESRTPNQAHLLFMDDPLKPDTFDVLFLVRLLHRDRSTEIDRVKMMSAPPGPDQLASYDYVFDYRGGHFSILSSPWRRGPAPTVVLERGHPQISHKDWQPVDQDHPVFPNEELIVKAMDLGETDPPQSPGTPFPEDPLARVVAKVQVRVNGAPASVLAKVGWPHETNQYRVDVQVPARLPSGLSWIQISVNGVAGPAVEFPVR